MDYITHSSGETMAVAEAFAKTLSGNEVIAFTGDLGSGKTCFTKGLAKGLGFNGTVVSPTFSVVNEYRGGRYDIFHFDMYRIENFDELYSVGFFDYLAEDGITVIEWSENIENLLPDDTVFINIEKIDDETRKIGIGGEDKC